MELENAKVGDKTELYPELKEVKYVCKKFDSENALICCREAGHSGKHIACGVTEIFEIWE